MDEELIGYKTGILYTAKKYTGIEGVFLLKRERAIQRAILTTRHGNALDNVHSCIQEGDNMKVTCFYEVLNIQSDYQIKAGDYLLHRNGDYSYVKAEDVDGPWIPHSKYVKYNVMKIWRDGKIIWENFN